MGTMISRNRAVSLIHADLETAVNKSAAVGGKVADIAAEELVEVHATLVQTEEELAAARAVEAPLVSALQVAHSKAIHEIRLIYDLTWNHVGRPACDHKLSLLFPSGSAHYVDGDPEKLPLRMELLARLFEKRLHPKLSKAQGESFAGALRAAAKMYSDALDAARLPVTNVVLLERTRTAMGRAAHAALAAFKRRLKAAGYTEAQIHEIIPSHPADASKKGAAKKGEAEAEALAVPDAPATEAAGGELAHRGAAG